MSWSDIIRMHAFRKRRKSCLLTMTSRLSALFLSVHRQYGRCAKRASVWEASFDQSFSLFSWNTRKKHFQTKHPGRTIVFTKQTTIHKFTKVSRVLSDKPLTVNFRNIVALCVLKINSLFFHFDTRAVSRFMGCS